MKLSARAERGGYSVENFISPLTNVAAGMSLRLVQLGRDGLPAEMVGALSQTVEQVCTATASLYERNGFEPPWFGYLALRESELVGACSFRSPPCDGKAEIAYFTFPGFEGEGIATAMARSLIEIARQADARVVPTALTLREHSASPSILRKVGFEFAAPIHQPEDGEVWEWHLPLKRIVGRLCQTPSLDGVSQKRPTKPF